MRLRTLLTATALALAVGSASAQETNGLPPLPGTPDLTGSYAVDFFETAAAPRFTGGLVFVQNRHGKLTGGWGLTNRTQGIVKGRMRPEGDAASFAATLIRIPRHGVRCRLVLVGAWAPAHPGDIAVSGAYRARDCGDLDGAGHFLGIQLDHRRR